MFETFFGGPNVLLFVLAALFLSIGILELTPPFWEWFAVTVVFISVLAFVSVVPCIWTACLLWSGRQQHRADIETS